MRERFAYLALAGALLFGGPSLMAGPTMVAPQAEAHFVDLQNGATVASPFKVRFGSTHIAIAPAGAVTQGSGHYLLLIDTRITPSQGVGSLPNDPQHLHFNKGQTEAVISLPPGKHTLQIAMADGRDQLHARPVESQPVTVTVK